MRLRCFPLAHRYRYSTSQRMQISDSAPVPPPPFLVNHEKRTANFELFGRGPVGESVLVNCQLPTQESRRPSNGIPPAILWNVSVIRDDLTMDFTCSTLNEGFLCIDGMSFSNSPGESYDNSMAACRKRYQGPLFHNGMFACLMLGIPVLDTVHPYRQHSRNWYNPNQGILTQHTKYDHMPVHTINPELYDAFLQYVNELGITDDLAAFISKYSSYIFNQEIQLWCDDIDSILLMKRSTAV